MNFGKNLFTKYKIWGYSLHKCISPLDLFLIQFQQNRKLFFQKKNIYNYAFNPYIGVYCLFYLTIFIS